MYRGPPRFTRTDTLFPDTTLLLSGLVISLLILILGKPLLLLLAGPQFAAAYPLLLLLGIAASIDLIGVSVEPLLMATNHARKSVTIKLINAALLLCLLSILLPRLGQIGRAHV